MDGRTGLVVVCAVAGGAWALLVLALLVGRLRHRRRPAPVGEAGVVDEWRSASVVAADAEAGDREAQALLYRALRGDTPELRTASVTALGSLGGRHEWAVDGLVEALAESSENAVRVAEALDRLAPRPGPRLPPLLGHPSPVVRFYAVRLLARYPSLAERHVPDACDDWSPHVRAAALETLRIVGSAGALRVALRSLEDPHPQVRAQACRAAVGVSGRASASSLVPLLGDRSWWVREAARESLVAAGNDAAPVVARALDSADEAVRNGAALVLQDIGYVDALADGDDGQLERILDAGGGRLRGAARERARLGVALRPAARGELEATP